MAGGIVGVCSSLNTKQTIYGFGFDIPNTIRISAVYQVEFKDPRNWEVQSKEQQVIISVEQ